MSKTDRFLPTLMGLLAIVAALSLGLTWPLWWLSQNQPAWFTGLTLSALGLALVGGLVWKVVRSRRKTARPR